MRTLPLLYSDGKATSAHAGFGVHKVIGRVGQLKEMIGGLYDTAEKAVNAADRLGEGHQAYRILRSQKGNLIPHERVKRSDLPVTVK